MNFLFILNTFYPNVGGVENATLEICKRLQRKSHKVYVLTTDKSNFVTNNGKLLKHETLNGIKIYRIRKKFRFFGMPFKALYLTKRFQINYVYITDFWGSIALFLKKIFRIPFVYVLNGYNPLCPRGVLLHERICEGFGLLKCLQKCRKFSLRFLLTLNINQCEKF